MRMRKLIVYTLSVLLPCMLLAQRPEKQVSFARESKPHAYYVAQAELWWKEVQRDKDREESWYNYFRACRNAQGTADWRTDFVNESPYLQTGDSIVAQIGQRFPHSFTFHYLTYLNHGIGTENGAHLLEAYRLNPDFEGIHSSMISYAESTLDTALRRQVNERWYKTNYLSEQLLNYAYNVLMSMDSGAVLFTQHDNDTYPVWMLQDALHIRPDVTVINIDFFLIESYRDAVYKRLGVPELKLGPIDQNEYHSNWRKVLTHVLRDHRTKRPLYLGMTVANELYKDFEKQLYPAGLCFRFSRVPLRLDKLNRQLYEHVFMLDPLYRHFTYDRNQANVDILNLNYLHCFERVYAQYRAEKKTAEARRLKALCLLLAGRTGQQPYVQWVEETFR